MSDPPGTRSPHRADASSASGSSLFSAGLPIPLTRFFGREQDIATVTDLFLRPDVRLLTLTGPGGVGKTRLAIQVARAVESEFADGVVFIDLTPLTDASLVAQSVARGLDFKATVELSDVDLMAAAIRERELLLVLDNFEHVISAAPLFGNLLESNPHVTVLVTSREPLRLLAERVFHVPALTLGDDPQSPGGSLESDAVRLFLDRADAVSAGFSNADVDVASVAAICARLDGLPLAIELAAARVSHLTPSTLVSKMEHRLPLLTGGARDAPARQRTMRDAIAWSYDLLSDDEQELLRRLAVFQGGFTLEAAEALAGAPDDSGMTYLDGIRALVSKSLILLDARRGKPDRYRMLETIREFALDQLAASGEEFLIRRRHADFFMRMVELADASFQQSLQVRAYVEHVEADYDNFRLALSFYAGARDAARELQMASLLYRFWFSRGWLREGISILQDALDRGSSVSAVTRAGATILLAQLYGETGDPDRAIVASGSGLALAREADDDMLLLHALVTRGMTFRWDHNRLDEAIEVLEESVILGESLGRPILGTVGMMNLGASLFDRGERERGIALLEESLATCRACEAHGLVALALARLGRVAQVEGQPVLAAERYRESLQVNWATGAVMYYDRVLVGLAGLAIDHGQPEVSARLIGAVEIIQKHTGATSLMWPEELDRVKTALQASPNAERYAGEMEIGRRLHPAAVQEEALALAKAIAENHLAGDARSTPKSPFGLSRRELEVLRLLAAGKTDREIAESLFTSPRTVNTQVTSVYGKLGVHSRTEAALAAQRAGLLET